MQTSILNQEGDNLGGASFIYIIRGVTVDPRLNCKWLILVLREDQSILCIIRDQLIVREDILKLVGLHTHPVVIQPRTESMVIGVALLIPITDALIVEGIPGA
jgi:hypothetical protein